MLGVRGGAWAGGIFVVLAALYLAKLGYDQGYFTPILRVTAMILAGTAALVWAEIGLRKGYRGRFGMYIPPLMEALGRAELTHDAKNNGMRAI